MFFILSFSLSERIKFQDLTGRFPDLPALYLMNDMGREVVLEYQTLHARQCLFDRA